MSEALLVPGVTFRKSCWHKHKRSHAICKNSPPPPPLFSHFPFPRCISLFFQLYLGTQLKCGKIGAKVANYIIIRVQSSLVKGGEKTHLFQLGNNEKKTSLCSSLWPAFFFRRHRHPVSIFRIWQQGRWA